MKTQETTHNRKQSFKWVLTSAMLIGVLGTASTSLGEGDTWTRKADMPTGRWGHAVGVVNGKVYVMGGNRGPFAPGLSILEEYDPATDAWTTKAPMPTGRFWLSASVVNGKIYAIGGVDGFKSVEAYDPATDTWTIKADMPTARCYLSTEVVEGKIYAMGGSRSLGGAGLAVVEMYDPETDIWTKKADLPRRVEVMTTGVVKGMIYAIGGAPQPGVAVSTVNAYDPATDKWTEKASTPTKRAIACASTVDDKIYVSGGLTSRVTALATVEVYDPATDTWETKTDMPRGRIGLSSGAVNGKIYAIGGVFTWQSSGVSRMEEYDTGFVPGVARNPFPGVDVADVDRDSTLSWRPHGDAETYDLYLGTSWEDVNAANANVLVSLNQDANSFDPGRLAFDQTYFWRVDEVNGAPDYTVSKGGVWSFTTEPIAYPILNVMATASSSQGKDMGPEKTIDSSGLDGRDEHGTLATDMWLSRAGAMPTWIQYEFDRVYKLHEMWVWNSNQVIEPFLGLGAKDVIIETSRDGNDWTQLEDLTQFAQGTGAADYTHNATVNLRAVLAKYVRMTVQAGYGVLPQYGLSEVRFFSIPIYAREPEPAVGAITEGADIVLSWRAGREAASHQVYLGTDAQDLSLLGVTTESTFAVGALNYAQTYYWSVTEVNELETPPSHTGEIWSFSTPDYAVVDDFDQYDNLCNRIFFSWEDGLGHNGGEEIEDCDVPLSTGNGSGSVAGHAEAPFAERTIVNVDSKQSLPLSYDNSDGLSETSITLAGQDWSTSGFQTLSLFFYGQPSGRRSKQLYVKINNIKVLYNGDSADLALEQWQQWDIDLTSLDGLQNVTKLTIGVEGAGAAGMLYIDDIRLYP